MYAHRLGQTDRSELTSEGSDRAAQQLVDEDQAVIRARCVPGRPDSSGQQRRFRAAPVAGPAENQPDHQQRLSPLPPLQGTFRSDGQGWCWARLANTKSA